VNREKIKGDFEVIGSDRLPVNNWGKNIIIEDQWFNIIDD